MDDATNGVKTKPRQPKKKKKAPSTREPPFHQVLTESVRDKVQAKGFDLTLYGTFDIALGDARIKLGLGQYAGLAHKDGIIAEGSYGCDEEGTVTFAWKSAICFQEGTWKPYNIENIVKSISLAKGTYSLSLCSVVVVGDFANVSSCSNCVLAFLTKTGILSRLVLRQCCPSLLGRDARVVVGL